MSILPFPSLFPLFLPLFKKSIPFCLLPWIANDTFPFASLYDAFSPGSARGLQMNAKPNTGHSRISKPETSYPPTSIRLKELESAFLQLQTRILQLEEKVMSWLWLADVVKCCFDFVFSCSWCLFVFWPSSVYILTFSLSVKQMLEEDFRLKAVESCECIKSCHFNGSVEADGSTWTDGCDVCSCVVCMTFIYFYSLFEPINLSGNLLQTQEEDNSSEETRCQHYYQS